MATTRVKLNHAGFAALLKSAEVQADINRRAQAIAASAGSDYEALPAEAGRTRARALVTTKPSGIRREARDHKLLGALDAGRG